MLILTTFSVLNPIRSPPIVKNIRQPPLAHSLLVAATVQMRPVAFGTPDRQKKTTGPHTYRP